MAPKQQVLKRPAAASKVAQSALKRPAAVVNAAQSALKRPAAAVHVSSGSKALRGFSALAPSTASFERLSDDALAQVLARAASPSLPALAATCRRCRAMLATDTFLAYRLEAGCVEVVVVIDSKTRDHESWLSEDEWSEDEDDDSLGNQGDYECTRVFNATIYADGITAGGFEATIIDRDACRRHAVFLSACDAESQELIDIGSVLFNEEGLPRLRELKLDRRARTGGFLYIASWKLQDRFRPNGATEVTSQAIKKLLTLPEISARWTVAAYIAEGDSDQRLMEDCLPFVRVRFGEIDAAHVPNAGWLYSTKALLQQDEFSHTEVMRLPLRASQRPLESPRPEPQGLDAVLQAVVRAAKCENAAVFAEIDRLIELGASLDGSCGLHAAAYCGRPHLVREMVQRRADINAFDHAWHTPLMLAAVALANTETGTNCADILIQLGADKAKTDDWGRTALGVYRATVRSHDDCRSALTDEPRLGTSAAIEASLRPLGGPTLADEAAK